MVGQVRGNVFWVQLVTGRRGKVTDKKSYFDQVSWCLLVNVITKQLMLIRLSICRSWLEFVIKSELLIMMSVTILMIVMWLWWLCLIWWQLTKNHFYIRLLCLTWWQLTKSNFYIRLYMGRGYECDTPSTSTVLKQILSTKNIFPSIFKNHVHNVRFLLNCKWFADEQVNDIFFDLQTRNGMSFVVVDLLTMT